MPTIPNLHGRVMYRRPPRRGHALATVAITLCACAPTLTDPDGALTSATVVANQPFRPGAGSVLDLVAGISRTCALLDTGQVRCWGSPGLTLGYADSGDLLTGEAIGDDERPATAGFIELGEPAKQLTAGDRHTCALLDSGGVRCWGDGRSAALGYGTEEIVGDDETPAAAGDLDIGADVREVVGGSNGSCAVLHDGKLRCWTRRAVAPPSPASLRDVTMLSPIPASVPALDLGEGVQQIALAPEHSCALLESGRVRCWGSGENGRLGYANTADIDDPSAAGDVDVGAPVKQLALGPSQTCAVLEGGSVRCWGFAGDGRLGYGNREDIGDDETPAAAGDVPVGGPVRALGARGYLVCALLESGSVRCWGPGFGRHPTGDEPQPDDGVGVDGGPEDGVSAVCTFTDLRTLTCPGFLGALGYGLTGAIGDDETPASVGDLQLAGPVKKLAVGGSHACVLLDTGGVQCWGTSGDLGYGHQEEIGDDEPPAAAGFVDVAGERTAPVQPSRVLQLSVGAHHACVLLDSSTVRCWGEAEAGQLGYGNKRDVGDDEEPRSVGDVSLRGAVRQVSAGFENTCAVLDSGAIRCWGPARDGVLGYGDDRDVGYADVPASAGYVEVGGPAREVQTGEKDTCAVLLDGRLRCWGLHAPLTALPVPGAVAGTPPPATVTDVDVGGRVRQVVLGDDACVLLESGSVRCWGFGRQSLVGYGIDTPSHEVASPAQLPEVPLQGRATQIARGDRVACALLEDGAVQCWGQAASFDFRVPTQGFRLSMATVALGARATHVSAGGDTACAVLEDGTLRCWNQYYVSALNRDAPELLRASLTAPIALAARAVGVGVGQGYQCALLETGQVRCWGSTESGQLGQPVLFGLDTIAAGEVAENVHLF